MTNAATRKPIANFFVLKTLQLRLIYKIVGVVMLTTVVSCLSVLAVYYLSYSSLLFYSMDTMTDALTKQNIFSILLPVLGISIGANLLIAIGIGFYASRKYAIPIFKLEQWASLLLAGKLTAVLHFREKEEMIDLTSKCNEVADFFRQHFMTIKQQVEAAKKVHQDSPAIQAIEKSLEGLHIHTDTIEVNTGFYQNILRQDTEKK